MIYSDSRYADGLIYKAYDATADADLLTVRRVFPFDQSNFFYYMWVDGDRLESVAFNLLGSASSWWRIMDYNPEILDGLNIPVGTLLRIPYDE